MDDYRTGYIDGEASRDAEIAQAFEAGRIAEREDCALTVETESQDSTRYDFAQSIRARTRQPKVQVVQSLCWRSPSGQLQWWDSRTGLGEGFVRFPAGDIEGEVEV